jgi:hypothetical protein
VAVKQDEWGPLTPPAAPSAGGEWGPLTPPAPARAAAPARQPAAAPQQPVDPGYPETYNPAPGLIATTPGRVRTGPGSYRGTSDDPVPLDDLSPEQIFNLPPGIFVRYPSGEIDQFSRVNPNAGATPTRIERGAQRQYGVLPADEREGPRTLGERFTSTFENLVNEGIPASVGRFVVGAADRSGYRTDPASGERYYVADVGQLTRNAERARRFNFERTTQGDEWYRQQGLINQMLAGGVTLAGGLAGGATDASNYAGGWGKNILTRAAGNFGFGAAQDVALQGLDIGSGVQEGYDPGRTLIAGGLNAAIPLGVEGAGRIFNRFAPNGTPELYGPPAPDGVGPARQPSTLPDVEVTAAAPGTVERMPMQGDEAGWGPSEAAFEAQDARIAAARKELADVNAALAAVEGDAIPSELLARRDAARAELSAAAAATPPVPAAALPDVVVPDFGPLRPPETSAAAPAAVAASAAQPPIVRHRETAAIVEAAAPPVAEGMTRLWRGNRVGEDGKGLAFTNDLPGIALPFREAYGGNLTYIDVPSARLAEYESKAGAAPGAEFQLPADLAATARVAALEAPTAAPRTLAEDAGAPGRAPDEVLPGSVVRALDDEFGIPPQPSPAVARAAEADLTLRAPGAERADPDLVGNIRLSNLNSEQDIARVLETARAAGGDFVEARRGTQTFDDIEALAADLDMTADTLIKRRAGQAFNAEEIRRARGLLVASAERVDDLARQIDEAIEPGDALNTDFREAILRHVAIQEQVAGISAEAGRALGAMRMLANSDNITPEMLASVLGGGMDVKGAARAIRQAGTRNPKARARAIKAAIKPTFTDMLVEYWYNSILSGPATHIVNVLSNTLTALNQLPEFAAAAAIGGARRALNIGPSERVLGTEVGQRAVGMVSGAVEGARAFADTLATGNVSDGVTKMEVAQQRAIPGVLGTVVRTPGRFLAAEDELFKAIARRMQINGLATRIAHQDGLRGEAAVARAAELSANPTKEMMDEADNYARYITFQDPMGRIGRGVMQVTSGAPILKLVVPFVRTPINLMKQTVERSPFAFVLKSWREDVRAGGVRGDLALAKAAVGSGYGLAIALAAQQGNITGAAPTDRAEREALLATGWQPFSLKIGDNYYSYRRLDPLGTLVGIAATMGQPHLFAGEREGAEKRFVVGFLAMLSDKTFMSGISDLVAAVDDPSGRRAEAYINRLMGSVLVPFSAAVSQTAKALDPTSRMAENIPDVLRSRIPGMSQDLPARYDVLGREMRTSPGGFEAFSPVTRAPVRDDPVANMILESGVRITPPNRTIKGTRLSAEAYSQYQAEAGAQIRNNMAWYMENPQVWNSMSKEERADETKRQVDRARETARQNLGLSQ